MSGDEVLKSVCRKMDEGSLFHSTQKHIQFQKDCEGHLQHGGIITWRKIQSKKTSIDL